MKESCPNMSQVEHFYGIYQQIEAIYRELYPRGFHLCLKLYTDDIEQFSGIKDELAFIDRAFTAYFSVGYYYRNLFECLKLAFLMRLNVIATSTQALSFQLNFNALTIAGQLHHDAGLTPLILSQLPLGATVEFGGKQYGHDLTAETLAIEVGDTRVSKVSEALKHGYEQIWVIPVHKGEFDCIYIFAKGSNWHLLEWWEKREEEDIHARCKVISQIDWE